MKTIIHFAACCLLTAIASGGCSDDASDTTTETPDNNTDNSQMPAGFTKSTSVFGIALWATAGTPDDKLLHAAQVLAQYLDNNADGAPDNQAVVDQMVAAKATLVVPKDESETESLMDTLPEDRVFQDLYA